MYDHMEAEYDYDNNPFACELYHEDDLFILAKILKPVFGHSYFFVWK